MQFVADFHLHSKYSRAVSQQMILPVMAEVAMKKGIDLLTASDFTHPLWFKEIQTLLVEEREGIYKIKDGGLTIKGDKESEPRFILSTEISSIYTQDGKLRRIHSLVFAPNIETVEKINAEMKKRGFNISSDGRPIIGLPAKGLLEMILAIDERCMLVPCHVWTPHFGLYGSASGFDSIEEAFGDLSKHIYAVETGLSSDPEMNWQIDELKDRSVLSFSDAHSPAKMGREATVFVAKDGMSNDKFQISNISYDDVRLAIMKEAKAKLKIGYTVEFYPEEGKYYFSGHRNCSFSRSPEEVEEAGTVCEVCGKKLTEGVFVRLKQLSGRKKFTKPVIKDGGSGVRWYSDPSKSHPPFLKLVPLLEICAEALSSTVASQKSKNLYDLLVKTYGSELEVLLKTPTDDIAAEVSEKVAMGIDKVRKGDIVIKPGFDGEYGVVKIWSEEKEKSKSRSQLSFDL